MAIDGIAARIDEYTRKKDEVFHLRCDALEGEVAAMYVDLVRLVNKGRTEVLPAVSDRDVLFDETAFGTKIWNAYGQSIRTHYLVRIERLINRLDSISSPWAFMFRSLGA